MTPYPHRHSVAALRVASHVLLVPVAVLALVVLTLSALSAGAMMANGVTMQATWLWPSLRWLLLNEPLIVATWTLWLAVPALGTVALVALRHRRVRGVAWWRWTALGGLTHAAALAAAAAMGWLPRVPPDAALYAAPAGLVIGLLATGWAEGVIRLATRLARRVGRYRRNGLEQRMGEAPSRGTNVSVRPS